MTVHSYDTFVGASGTALTAHTAPDGSTWAMAAIGGAVTGTTTPDLNGSGGVVGVSSSTFVLAIYSRALTSADYMVQTQYTDGALPNTSYTRLWLRSDGSGSNGYYIQLESLGGSSYRLDLSKIVAGTVTLLTSTTSLALTGTDSLYLGISASGSTITGYWQTAAAIAGSGWITCSVSDSSIAATGRAGLMFRFASGVAETLSNFRLQDVGTAYNAALPEEAVSGAVTSAGSLKKTINILWRGTVSPTGNIVRVARILRKPLVAPVGSGLVAHVIIALRKFRSFARNLRFTGGRR